MTQVGIPAPNLSPMPPTHHVGEHAHVGKYVALGTAALMAVGGIGTGVAYAMHGHANAEPSVSGDPQPGVHKPGGQGTHTGSQQPEQGKPTKHEHDAASTIILNPAFTGVYPLFTEHPTSSQIEKATSGAIDSTAFDSLVTAQNQADFNALLANNPTLKTWYDNLQATGPSSPANAEGTKSAIYGQLSNLGMMLGDKLPFSTKDAANQGPADQNIKDILFNGNGTIVTASQEDLNAAVAYPTGGEDGGAYVSQFVRKALAYSTEDRGRNAASALSFELSATDGKVPQEAMTYLEDYAAFGKTAAGTNEALSNFESQRTVMQAAFSDPASAAKFTPGNLFTTDTKIVTGKFMAKPQTEAGAAVSDAILEVVWTQKDPLSDNGLIQFVTLDDVTFQHVPSTSKDGTPGIIAMVNSQITVPGSVQQMHDQ
jgi:hypothetical protein